MTGPRTELAPISDAEEAQIQAGIASDPDNPEWTEDDFKTARPFKDASPALYAAWQRARASTAAGPTASLTLTLDRDVLERFRATGSGWEARMRAVLRRAADALPPA